MGTTDRGTNELFAKKAVQVLMRDVPTFFYFPGSCIEHASHLGVLGSLKLVDRMLDMCGRKWRYFASVSMMTNTFRDQSQNLFSSWRALFGDASAVATVKSLFPRCIAERWGSIDQTETRFLQAGVDRLAAAISHVFAASPKLMAADTEEADGPDALAGGTVVDAIAMDEQQAYSKKMGKWRRHTVETLRDPLFEKVLAVMHCCKAPFIHLSNFLKKKTTGVDVGQLAQLVCGRAEKMQLEFDGMLF